MRRTPLTLTHGLLCGFVLFSIVGTALGLRSWPLSWFVILPLASLFLELPLPPMFVRGATWVVRGAAAGAASGSLIMALYPIIPDATIYNTTGVFGRILVLLGGLLLLARASPEASVIPAALGALIAAFIPPEPSWMRASTGLAATCLIVWLALRNDETEARVAVRPLPLVFFVLLSAAIASGVAVLLPWAQPQVELFVAQAAFNDFEAQTGVATASKLGDVEKLSRSKRVALRFYADTAADLRVRVFTAFDGKAWKADPAPTRPLLTATVPDGAWPAIDATPGTLLAVSPASVAPGLLAAQVIVRSAESGVMPVPAHTVAVRVEDSDVDASPSGFLLPRSRASLYSVLFAAQDVAEGEPGPSMLAVPEKLDPRLRELAASITEGATSPSERAERIAAYFETGYRYTLDVGSFQTPDALAEFVFDKKKGYCEYFATATTLLLRLAGVPSRYVTGYAVRAFQWSDGHYVVRDSDAHAWSEAYLPGRGWVEVDATPAGDYQALHADLAEAGLLAKLQAAYDELAAFVNQGGARGVARGLAAHPIALSTLVVAFAAFQFRKRFRRAASSTEKASNAKASDQLSPELHSLLARVDSLCAAKARPRPPSRAPMEHVTDLNVALADDERAACLQAIAVLYAQKYGGRAAAPEDLAKANTALFALTARPAAR